MANHKTAIKKHFKNRLFEKFGIRVSNYNRLQDMGKQACLNGVMLRMKDGNKVEFSTIFQGQIMKIVYCQDSDLIYTCYK